MNKTYSAPSIQSNSLPHQPPHSLGSLESLFQGVCFAGHWLTEAQEIISTLEGDLLSGTGDGQVIQAAFGLAEYSLKVQRREHPTPLGKKGWVIRKDLEKVAFSWALKDTEQFSGLRVSA